MSVIGLRVGPFEIVREAIVPERGDWYRARRSGKSRAPNEVFVRLLAPDASADERSALQREYEALRALDDPRIPTPVAFYEGSGALVVDGRAAVTLDVLLAQRRQGAFPLSPATLLDLALEIAEALQHAHHRGRLHGHLSPDRIALSPDGRVWIWGFGPGSSIDPDPTWLAPERARSQPVTTATDQWSLAAVIASLVTGRPPWEDLTAARRGDPEPIFAGIDPQWPALGRLLRRALDPHPANRFPSLHPLRQELLALARQAGGTSDRRDIATQLARLAPAPHEPEESAETASAPEAAHEVALAAVPEVASPTLAPEPSPVPSPDEVRVDVASTPPTAPRLAAMPKRNAVPDEPLPVVRPDLGEEVPVARTTPLPASNVSDQERTGSEELTTVFTADPFSHPDLASSPAGDDERHPTIAPPDPPSEPSGESRPVTDERRGPSAGSIRVAEDRPSDPGPTDIRPSGPAPERLPEPPEALIKKVAPWAAAAMLVALLALTFWNFYR